MALLVGRYLYKAYTTPPEGASKFFITINSEYLSEPYRLVEGDEITGEILEVRKDIIYRELQGAIIKFIIRPGAIADDIFISNNDWNTYFRDRGIVQPGYTMKIRFIKTISKESNEETPLYPKGDVVLDYFP